MPNFLKNNFNNIISFYYKNKSIINIATLYISIPSGYTYTVVSTSSTV
jgi:hypothetical protein